VKSSGTAGIESAQGKLPGSPSLSDLPGSLRGQLPPAEEPQPGAAQLRRAAVLVLFIPSTEGWMIPLIRRPDNQRRHPGQIALPGGVIEAGDGSLAATALRESWEEIGVPPERVEVLGRLPAVVVSVSGFEVHPFVGRLDSPISLIPHDREVAAIVKMPASVLVDPLAVREEPAPPGARHPTIFAFDLPEGTVWGATARILASLAQILRDVKASAP